MKPIHTTLDLLAITLAGLTTIQAQDPLPSWNDGKTKESIVAFVAKVTKEGSSDFVPPADRIAHSGTTRQRHGNGRARQRCNSASGHFRTQDDLPHSSSSYSNFSLTCRSGTARLRDLELQYGGT